jgi:gas vesicle protein
MDTSKIVLGILGGVAAGALLGVLFSPEKRKKTGKKDDFTGEIKGKIEDLYQNIKIHKENLLQDTKKFNLK